jgi:DNA-binding response OmpR family regulator
VQLTDILVVEDEASIAEAIRLRLESEGFGVQVAHTGSDALALAAARRPDLVVLDLMLPEMDGFDVCRELQRHDWTPVLMLTARAEEADKVAGLAVGADDYLTKPFSMRELTMRVRAILRRIDRARSAAPAPVLRVGDVRLDPVRRRVSRDGRDIILTPLEFDILSTLAASPGAVFSRDRLMDEVWGYRDQAGSRTVDTHVAALRRKLGDDAGEPRYIRTIHGVGYAVVEGGA